MAFDGTRAYGVRPDGSIEVATAGQTAPAEVTPAPRGEIYWIAAGNNSLVIAASMASANEKQVTMMSVGN
ncbi:hypothetical protein GCM10009527_022800 [Actinomadura nitritigenes]|uniref:Lipoprotein LpqB beta-propeller domain-containing protein n=1 Tax=Actinomadura nitritigenes TaxID=134602 RepID=A0ABS3RCT8_9ACTN|nr:hypothetical protein [Actinomadura nitritigenes]MBO2444049.1 hypothetical protein [Actinomadura nitritigenes]